jgi:DNA primase
VVYLFDGDEAGLKAADRASEFVDASSTPEAGGSQIELFVAVIPGGLDPADYVGANYLADRLLVDFETARAAVEKARPPAATDEDGAQDVGGVAAPEVLDASARRRGLS